MAKRLKDLSAGSLIVDKESSYYGKPVVWMVLEHDHSGYPSNSTTVITKNIISIKAIDGEEYTNPDTNRSDGGNNRYIYSNIRSWLNSERMSWYSETHKYDTPPSAGYLAGRYNPYDKEDGFMRNLSSDFKKAIQSTKLKVLRNDADNGGIDEFTDNIFLLSLTEVGLDDENLYREGVKFNYFKSNSDRIAYPNKEAVDNNNYPSYDLKPSLGWHWWLRSPHESSSYSASVKHVRPAGNTSNLGSDAHFGGWGIRPALNLNSNTIVSDTSNSNGEYTIIWNKPPNTPNSISVPSEVFSGQTITVNWGTASDPDGDRVGYKLERQYNSGSWSQVYQGYNRSFTEDVRTNWNTLRYRVRAYDPSNEHSSFRTSEVRTVIHNRPPTISGKNEDLGNKEKGFEVKYTVTDPDEGDKVKVTVIIDGKEVYSNNNHELGKESTITITDEELLTLEPGEHMIVIKAVDSKNASDTRRYTFSRVVNETTVTLNEPLPADDKFTKAIMSISRNIPPEVDFTVEVTNNAYDDEPVWKDVTQNVIQSRKIFFENQVATAGKFGFNFKVTLKRNSEGEPGYIRSIGGNFE